MFYVFRLEIVAEFDCFAKGSHYLLTTLPREELFYPECTAEEEVIRKWMIEMTGA